MNTLRKEFKGLKTNGWLRYQSRGENERHCKSDRMGGWSHEISGKRRAAQKKELRELLNYEYRTN